jgi:non-ribosomal peptide synthetase component E (peptide arylation enzyme)
LTTIGRPLPGSHLKIVGAGGIETKAGKPGRLFVQGPACSLGYFGDEHATQEAWGKKGLEGWYNTGDIARVDEKGYLILEGRVKDMILRGGQNIFPQEIENLLQLHPKIVQAAVIGLHDSVMGERACACVRVDGGQTLSFKEMVHFLKDKGVAIYKLPERLEVFSDFSEFMADQKINRKALRDWVAGDCTSDVGRGG